ncbi:alpha/beta hydrolase [Mangrovimonas sp. DI 80]|uniref:alpha/beta hydrolase n=1 Tax=Mangrovimonas sp. DI 80 TaxID=1779330 RepID=UPI0009767190|nr:alpha/beta hydrolase-fold protein [Mangrovimonas sp. DI 80]OMP32531.1 esterase [Mangrovimonas sp. DI 80]
MHKFFMLLVFVLGYQTLQSQVLFETMESSILGESRELKIQLPSDYNPEDKTEYPIIIVFDGDYLFEPVIGNVNYQSYWGEMPKCIVVGINQASTREVDFFYDDETYFPAHEGARFFEFVGVELIPYIESRYKASKFRIGVGHNLSANFMNYYVFKEYPIFRAFVEFSPDLAPEMASRLEQRLNNIPIDTFFYLATAENDLGNLNKSIVNLDKTLGGIENPKLHYRFDNFDDANHYSLVGLAIPKAMNQIFSLYKPINKKEYSEQMLTYEGSPYDYLMKKYDDIKLFYGFEKKVVEIDLKATAAASKKKDDMESLKNVSKLAKKEYPDSMISAYYQGMYYEEYGDLKKALQYYQSGLLLNESEYIDKDMLLEKVYDIKDQN